MVLRFGFREYQGVGSPRLAHTRHALVISRTRPTTTSSPSEDRIATGLWVLNSPATSASVIAVGCFVASRTTKSGAVSAGSSPPRNKAKLQPSGARLHPTTAALTQPCPRPARTRRARIAGLTKNEATKDPAAANTQSFVCEADTASAAAAAPPASNKAAVRHERNSTSRSLRSAEGGAGTRPSARGSDTRSG